MSHTIKAPPPAEAAPRKSRAAALSLRFLLLFVLYLIIGNSGLAIPFVERHVIEPWTEANVRIAAGLATLFGMEAEASGKLLTSGTASLVIKKGCNGVEALVVLVAAILAFPARWDRRLLGLVLGTVAVFGFNLLRLVNLLLIAKHFPARVELFHVYIWQTLIVLLAFGTFLLWGALLATRD